MFKDGHSSQSVVVVRTCLRLPPDSFWVVEWVFWQDLQGWPSHMASL